MEFMLVSFILQTQIPEECDSLLFSFSEAILSGYKSLAYHFLLTSNGVEFLLMDIFFSEEMHTSTTQRWEEKDTDVQVNIHTMLFRKLIMKFRC